MNQRFFITQVAILSFGAESFDAGMYVDVEIDKEVADLTIQNLSASLLFENEAKTDDELKNLIGVEK